MSYSIDGQDNVTIAGNGTLSGLPNGSHNLTVYVTDRIGNVGVSEIIYFSVEAPFPALVVVAIGISAAVLASVGLIYFKKKKGFIRKPKMPTQQQVISEKCTQQHEALLHN